MTDNRPGSVQYEELNVKDGKEPNLPYGISVGKGPAFRRSSFDDLHGPVLSQMSMQTVVEKLQTSIIDGSIQVPAAVAEGILVNQVFGY